MLGSHCRNRVAVVGGREGERGESGASQSSARSRNLAGPDQLFTCFFLKYDEEGQRWSTVVGEGGVPTKPVRAQAASKGGRLFLPLRFLFDGRA